MGWIRTAIVGAVIGLMALTPARADILIDGFEDVTDWVGLDLDTTIAHEGSASGRWDDQTTQRTIRKDYASPLNASSADAVHLWLHSATANGAWIQMSFVSDRATTTAVDQYRTRIIVDWTGWRHVWVPLDQFTVVGDPVGWHAIDRVLLLSDGWGREPLGDTVLRLDDLRMATAFISGIDSSFGYDGPDYQYDHTVHLHNRTASSVSLTASVGLPPGSPWSVSVTPTTVTLAPGATRDVAVGLRLDAVDIHAETWLTADSAEFSIVWGGSERDVTVFRAAVPVPARSRPRLLVDSTDIGRIKAWAATYSWASSRVNALLARADRWPDQHNATYGLGSWSPPPEGGQAYALYVCPVHGVALKYEGPGQNVCPIDDQNWIGWPYDQVVYLWRHRESAAAARDLAMAFRLSGNVGYALAAREILTEYAAAYLSYPLHDINDGPGHTGGRVTAQTLDEAFWLMDMAWAYDLIANSGVLTHLEQNQVEAALLAPAVDVIRRSDTIIGNWQAIQDAAVAAVGFGVEDPRLAWLATHGPFGFDYQLAEHVTLDGFWYEGSWAYHFVSLKGLSRIALMAELAGVDLVSNPTLKAMFTSPLLFSMPNLDMPRFNDGGSGDLTERRDLFEVAYQRYGHPELSVPLFGFARIEDALYWGAEELPGPFELDLPSVVFPDSGYVVLRGGSGPDTHYLALDFGPHGGGHGHYDKLGFVSFANGGVQAVDPGAQLYGAASHETWDKATVAHNTVVVDEVSQEGVTGNLRRSVLLPDVGFARAEAGPVYSGAAELIRNVTLTPDYAVDVFEARSLDGMGHNYDLVYHNRGTVSTPLSLAPYGAFPDSAGYQHLSNPKGVAVSADFLVDFSSEVPDVGDAYGTVFESPASVDGSFTISSLQSTSGGRSGRMGYDFSASQGYVVFQSEQLATIYEQPHAIQLDVYGDGSGHELLLRVYDAAAERFSTSVGQIDWTGWQTIQLENITSWESVLGDGVLNAPVSKVGLQVVSRTPGDLTYGKAFPSSPVISATTSYSTEQAATGSGSWKLGYDFSAAQGYVVYQSEVIDETYEAPAHLQFAVRGDLSGNTLAVRVHDATEEKYRFTVGSIDWSGWATIRAENITSWMSSDGDGDGVFDLPPRRIAIQLISDTGGTPTGSLYIDDVTMEFPLVGSVDLENFEWQPTGATTGELFVDTITLDYPSFGAVRIEDFDDASGGVAWHVVGNPGTTLVLGDGFADDPADVVPFAMLRRVETDTDFVSLIEPYVGGHEVQSFEALTVSGDPGDAARAFEIATSSWTDWLLTVGEGPNGVPHSAGVHSCDGLLCYVRRGSGGDPVTFALGGGSALTGPEGDLVNSSVALATLRADQVAGTVTVRGDLDGATVQLYAPSATRVIDGDGNEWTWYRDGDHVVVQGPGTTPCDRILEDTTVSTLVVEESCGTLTAGPNLAVESPGDLTLRAADRVVVKNGVSIGGGARLTIELDAALAGP